MIEISRDRKRIYFNNSLYSIWDTQFYPEGLPGQMVMAHNGVDGFVLDRDFHIAYRDEPRAHQIRLEGGH